MELHSLIDPAHSQRDVVPDVVREGRLEERHLGRVRLQAGDAERLRGGDVWVLRGAERRPRRDGELRG